MNIGKAGEKVGAVLLAGPTASGKSALAMDLAERLNGVIINADSMQVYNGLRVLTARPSLPDEARVRHRLYGHVAPERRYSVGAWLADVEPVLSELVGEGRPAIVTGGTGLYFRALTEGLADIPAAPTAVRERLAREVADLGAPALHERLRQADPTTADRLEAGDTTRIVRALEVLEVTGRSITEWQAQKAAPLLDAEHAVRLVMMPERAELHSRIAARAAAMVEAGALQEVEALLKRRLDPELPVMKAIGVREFGGHLRGESSLEAAVADLATETRRYAKRQMTWFRNQMAGWRVIGGAGEALDLAALGP